VSLAELPTLELPPLSTAGRLDRLRDGLAEASGEDRPVGALLVTTPANIRWLTGFSGSAGLLCVTAGRALLTSDGRYRTQSVEQLTASGVADDIEITIGGVQVQRDAILALIGELGPVGLEADQVSWSAQRSWNELLGSTELVPTRGLVESLRVVKDEGEILRMERAAAIADHALASVLHLLTGDGSTTESAFAAALDHGSTEQRRAPSRPSWPLERTRPNLTPGRAPGGFRPAIPWWWTSGRSTTATGRT